MPAPEFSRLVRLSRLGSEPFRQEIAANRDEREALTRRFDLVSLDSLAASVELMRQLPQGVRLRARFEAAFVQSCVVTLDPVEGAVSGSFTLLYGPPELEADGVGGLDDEAAFEPLPAEAIDIGEAVAQEFALALPPFPRRADADVAAPAAPVPDAAGPFAALAKLAGGDKGGE